MSTPSWMLVRLALETRLHHKQADSDRLAMMEVATGYAYRACLARIYGLEASVEVALSRIADIDPSLVRARVKAGRLRDDLLALGMSSHDIATLPLATLHVRTSAQALGWMFVVERLTLLSGLIRRHLSRLLPIEMNIGSRYLTPYGDAPGAQFRAFGDAVARYAIDIHPDAIVSAANEAFRAQRLWYSSRADAAEEAVPALARIGA
ncbi:MAG: biliverdin-producing heme oxygenase [Kofleriaceae bacterium]|nr:biliverdin-producing heme oxygenase [Kofleriaceae bacterium]